MTFDEFMNTHRDTPPSWYEIWQAAQAAALRSPAPAATVTGWRCVENEEVLLDGDEIWSDHDYAWNPLKVGIGHKKTYGCPVRRRLPAPPVDAVTARDEVFTALVEVVREWSAWTHTANVMVYPMALRQKTEAALRSALAAVRGAGGEGG